MPKADIFEIKGRQAISDIETELAALNKQRPKRLLLPTNVSDSAIGGEAALIQLIATWGAASADATLVTHVKDEEDPTGQLRKLAKRPSGFLAIWMADSISDRSGKRDLKVIANSCSESVFTGMWHGRDDRSGNRALFDDGDPYVAPRVIGSGAQVFLACVDHDRWAIPQCYFADKTLRGRDDFIALARAAITRATQGSSDSPVSPDLYPAFGAIFHELFKNTHEHARHDSDGAMLRRSIRGIIVNRRTWTREKIESLVSEAPPLRQFTADQMASGRDDYLRCLEISVFDSGVGLARHWMRQKWTDATTPQEELEACEQCLQRWASATDKPHKGAGLHEVATMMSQLHGFMRLRSGRLSLFRNFNTAPVDEENTAPVKLFDWTSQTPSPTAMAPVAGALFTLLIPVASA
jgi:hypothetical protein